MEEKAALLSEELPAFLEALEILYIRDNVSGRLGFVKAWPAAAVYVFGAELMGFDRDGVSDPGRRAVLEDEAEERRLVLVGFAEEVEEKSRHQGALQAEYVQGVVERLGRDLALLYYDAAIVERFLPKAPAVEEVAEFAAAPEDVVIHESHSFVPEAPASKAPPVVPVVGETMPNPVVEPEVVKPKTVSGTMTFVPSKKKD
ncbi:MAG: hypothetical protein ACRBCT_07445 [Alphaproteobacteria bacterium]